MHNLTRRAHKRLGYNENLAKMREDMLRAVAEGEKKKKPG